jgi:acylaminoacyl-peptidase
MGGSHGGFLALHLAATGWMQCAVARNPVANIASMAAVTDIPDWTVVEACGPAALPFPPLGALTASPEQLALMFRASPIAHIDHVPADCPVLLFVGAKDLRVPPSQSVEYLHALRARRDAPPVSAFLYPNDSHPLRSPATNDDNVLLILRALLVASRAP